MSESAMLILFFVAVTAKGLVFAVNWSFGLSVRLVDEGLRLVGSVAAGRGISQGSKR